MSVHQHDDLMRLIQGALADKGSPLEPHECERMHRFLDQLDAAIEEDGGPKRIAQVLAAFDDDGQVRCVREPERSKL